MQRIGLMVLLFTLGVTTLLAMPLGAYFKFILINLGNWILLKIKYNDYYWLHPFKRLKQIFKYIQCWRNWDPMYPCPRLKASIWDGRGTSSSCFKPSIRDPIWDSIICQSHWSIAKNHLSCSQGQHGKSFSESVYSFISRTSSLVKKRSSKSSSS